MSNKLIIKGAYYKVGNTILIPHFTGEFICVDCTEYVTLEELKEDYDKKYIKNNKEDYIIVGETIYYYAEYSPCNVNNDWELLSDLSELEHIEEEYNF